jgi:hypothetical protein
MRNKILQAEGKELSLLLGEVLQPEGKELSRLLGEILQPEKNKHTIAQGSYTRGNCAKCGKNLDWSQWHKECISVDPIPLDDWNVAMKWRDWAAEEVGIASFKLILVDVMEMGDFVNKVNIEELIALACETIATIGKPKYYLQAAALCKLESEAK